jgi:hypothetical protein
VYIRRAIARQSPSSSRGAAVGGGAKPQRGGARNGRRRSPRYAQRGCIEGRVSATDLPHPEIKARVAAREGGSSPRAAIASEKWAYDVADLAARVISPFRHALKSVMFLKRVRRRRAAIAFCPRLLQPSSLSSKGLLVEARPF